MDEALTLADYLPVSFRSSSEEAYIRFLWVSFESNCKGGKRKDLYDIRSGQQGICRNQIFRTEQQHAAIYVR